MGLIKKHFSEYIILRDLSSLCLFGILIGHMFPVPIIFWRVLFVILCFIALTLRIKELAKIEKWMFLLVSLCFVHFLLSYLWVRSPSTTLIGAILFTMPACNLFHLLKEKGVITPLWIDVMAVFLTLSAVEFFRYKSIVIIGKMLSNTLEEGDFTNNASTVFLGLIPFVMLSKNRIIQWGVIGTCWFFLMTGVKRGNILGATLPTLLFLIPYLREGRKSLWALVVLVSGLALGITYGIRWYEDNSYLQTKLGKAYEGDSSGRTDIWAFYLEYWASGDLWNLFWGYGFNGTKFSANDIHAHNDWIETLVDYGLIGISIMVGIFSSFVRLIKNATVEKLILISVFFICLEKSMLSMGYMDPLNVFLYITLGIVLGQMDTRHKDTMHKELRPVVD